MGSTAGERSYYVISDLHIGGDEQLETVEFYDELLEFLADIRSKDEDIELVINGDAFGLWEFTEIDGPAKFDRLLGSYPELFEALEKTGKKHRITLLPGNHDHELAAYDEYVDRFAEYNVDLVREPSITRPIGERRIYFEHGHQQDPNNRFDDFGNPYDRPLGYHYNTQIVSRAGHLSDRGRFNWLKDVQAVTPTERMPRWLLSKYVYREMNPLLRYAIVPFLFLFNISAILAVLAGLDLVGIWSMPVDRTTEFLAQYGAAGTAVYALLAANVAIAGLLLLVAIPLYLILRDIKHTIARFGLYETDLTVDHQRPYREAAREIFAEDATVSIFCYGHTHRSDIQRVGNRLLVNSGTWLKRLYRREVIAGVLPPVFYPTYELCAVRIERNGDEIEVEHYPVEKPNPSVEELSYTERLLTFGREPDPSLPEPASIPMDPD